MTPTLERPTTPTRAGLARLVTLGVLVAGLLASALPAQNVLVVVLDDVGVDKVAAYGESRTAGPTRTLDALARHGVSFANAWSLPVCAPARASILTGRFPARHGIGVGVGANGGTYLIAGSEVTLPEVLAEVGYRTAVVGKWQLASPQLPPAVLYGHPIAFGFERHLGAIANITDYFHWQRNDASAAGVSQSLVAGYVTSVNVDDALQLVDAWGSQPWFLWLAFNAPHVPLHVPPDDLTAGSFVGDEGDPVLYDAVLEAADRELGRLLAGIPRQTLARTWVVVLGDNGTYASAATPPFGGTDNHKGNLLEGGVNVPLIVSGPGVTRGAVCDALVSTVDLFSTIVELAGAAGPAGVELDSASLVPYLEDPSLPSLRPWVFSEKFSPNGLGTPADWRRGVRGERYKLIRRAPGGNLPEVAFYDLLADPWETSPLPIDSLRGAALAALHDLDAVLAAQP